jgi:cytidine deaminase
VNGQELVERAESASKNAYAPYSNYLVGAVLLLKDGRVYEGVNVENAAYPLGVCAERTAISKAASEGVRPGDIDAVGITASPCGGCRQWLVEFGLDTVIYADNAGEVVSATPASLLPDTFEL